LTQRKTEKERQLADGTGEEGRGEGGGAKSHDGEKAWYSIINYILLDSKKQNRHGSIGNAKKRFFLFFEPFCGIKPLYKASLKTQRQIFSFSQKMELSISVHFRTLKTIMLQ
jgi:hypothetical protein